LGFSCWLTLGVSGDFCSHWRVQVTRYVIINCLLSTESAILFYVADADSDNSWQRFVIRDRFFS